MKSRKLVKTLKPVFVPEVILAGEVFRCNSLSWSMITVRY